MFKRLLPLTVGVGAACAVMAFARADEPPSGSKPEAPAAEAPKAKSKAVFRESWFFDGNKKDLLGKAAPALDVADWHGGSATTLADLKGKVVVLDFWGVWCPPCRAAVPHTTEMATKYKDKGVVILGIHSQKAAEKMAQSATQLKMGYPTAKDAHGKSAAAYKVSFWPYYVIVDREGMVRAAGLNPAHLGDAIEEMLKEQPATPAANPS